MKTSRSNGASGTPSILPSSLVFQPMRSSHPSFSYSASPGINGLYGKKPVAKTRIAIGMRMFARTSNPFLSAIVAFSLFSVVNWGNRRPAGGLVVSEASTPWRKRAHETDTMSKVANDCQHPKPLIRVQAPGSKGSGVELVSANDISTVHFIASHVRLARPSSCITRH
jgi:hypothetical protein